MIISIPLLLLPSKGYLHLSTSGAQAARALFQDGASGGNLLAMYNLATLTLLNKEPCHITIGLFRKVLDGSYLRDMCLQAYRMYAKGYFERALIRYELASDQGSLLGQLNAAWMYEMQLGIEREEDGRREVQSRVEFGRDMAFHMYRKAAEQQAPEGNLKVGDYYYFGWGVSANPALAEDYYKAASDLQNAQATFNLGYMYHFGLGVERDLHLAKRYYDSAMELNSEAFGPSTLTLGLINLENWYNYIFSEEFVQSFYTGDLFSGLGYNWDTWLIIVLSVVLGFAIILRQIIATCLDTV